MKKGIFTGKRFGILIAALILFTAFLGFFPSLYTHKTANSVAVDAADLTYNDGYAAFAEGSTYTYTDRQKFLNYRDDVLDNNSAAAPADDTTTVTVTKTSSNHGEQENPYVINDWTTWKKFADTMGVVEGSATADSHGEEKYFALAVDLDFSDSARPSTVVPTIMTTFNGTFYGLGHTISNYTVTDSSTLSGTGLFRYGPWLGDRTALISDLNLEYTFSGAREFTGGIFGKITGSSLLTVLNCHTVGTINGSSAMRCAGGVVGSAWRENTAYPGGFLEVYRCSSKLSVSVTKSAATTLFFGGVVSGVWQDYTGYIYDCYGEVNANVYSTSGTPFVDGCGAVIGATSAAPWQYRGGTEIIRCAGKTDFHHQSGSLGWRYGSLFAFYDSNAETQGTILVRDCYTYGKASNHTDGKTYKVLPWQVSFNTNGTAYSSAKNKVDALRIYYAGGGANAWDWGVKDTVNANNYYGEEKTHSDLWTAAKGDSHLHTNIWTKDDLGESYTYSIEGSPVRNRKFDTLSKVTFYNLKKNGNTYTDEAISKDAVEYTYTTTANATQYLGADPAAPNANYEFAGWTLSKTSTTGASRNLAITNLNGNVKVYAVWNIKNVTAAISQSGGTLNTDTNKYEAESGGAGITLSANITLPSGLSASDYDFTYAWKKNTTTSAGTGSAINISALGGNGTYTYSYTVAHKTMPFVTASGVCSGTNAIQVEITGKSTTLDTFELTSPAYIGGTLSGVTFNLIMVSGNTPVAGTAVWKSTGYRVVAGTNQTQVVFTPNSSDYKTMTLNVEFTATPLTLTFAIPDIQNSDLVVDIDFNQPYSAVQIVDMFNAAYVAKIADDPTFESTVNHRTPKLDGIEIDSYNVAFAGATSPKTITVTFTDPKSYSVTLDYAYDGKTETSTAYWNQLVPTPTADRGVDYILEGWFETQNGILGSTAWDFASDRVTSDITLTAKWTQIVLTLTGITVTPPSNPFTVTALTPIDQLGLTVTATFKSSISDDPVEKVLPLKVGNDDGYEVRVGGILNGQLHVNTTSIVVSYRNQTETIPVTVNPISLDGYSGQIDFPDCAKDYTGSPLEIDPLRIATLPDSIRSHVTRIDITYQKSGVDKDKSEVVEQGEYTAIATFTTDPDYTLSPISATFTIYPPRLAVTVAWNSGTYSYTGSAQHPIAVLTDEDGVQLNASQFKYVIFNSSNAPSDGTDADSYTVRVALDTETERYFKLVGTTSTTFTISKAKVAKPTANITSFEYNGEEKSLLLEGFVESYMTLLEQGSKGTDAGPYTATVKLDKNHEWTDGGDTATFPWTITKAKISRPSFGSVSLEYNGTEQSVSGELYGFDENKMVITGDKGKDAKSYKASVTPNSNYTWDNEATPVTVDWEITKKLISIVWEDEDTYEKNGSTKYNPKIIDFVGLCEGDVFDPALNASSVRYTGDVNKSAAGSYIVKFASLNTSWAGNYEIEEDLGKGYRIIEAGSDPDDPNNYQVPDPANPDGSKNNGTTGNNPSDATFISYLPIILSGVALVLIIVFTVMTLNNASAAKNAMAKTKQLAQISYSFAPAGLLAIVLGLSQTNWWIIAGVLMGFALIMGIVAFLYRGKKRKALLLLEEEQRRVAEEKELAKEEKERQEQQRREEQEARRDNELKMMFAAMQQNYAQPQAAQPQLRLDDIRGIISETVTALLPGLQQAMALPPAQGDAEYYSRLNASAVSAETEELKRMMLQQQEQMAQQQSMISQLLAERQNAEAVYDGYSEPEEDLSWVGEGEDLVTLEESYGALSDEEKRCYYEIGSYIMNKPRTMQNDGKYAVLFKYRGRTLFKLTIKDDAPVLYYPLGDGGRGEVRVTDSVSFELAKNVIDRYVVKVDSELL